MASIFQRIGSEVWHAQFYVKQPDGSLKKIRVSTGKRSKKAAREAAAKIEAQHQGTVAADTEQGRTIRAMLEEIVVLAEQGKFNVGHARKFIADVLAATTGEKMESYTIRTWSAEWLRRKKAVTSPATMIRYSGSMKRFIAHLGSKADAPLESITAANVREWRDSINATRASKTANMGLQDVRSMFRAAVRDGLLVLNPATAVEILPETDSTERAPFTPAEIVKLLAVASHDWRGMILLGCLAGLRIGDAAALTWNSIDLEAKMIRLTPQKTARKGRKVEIPMHPDVEAFFMDSPAPDDSSALVFPTLENRIVGSKNGLSVEFIGIMKTAGVGRGDTTTANKSTSEKSFHSLRHSFVSALANADVSEELRMKLSGHSTRAAHQIYTSTDTDTLRRAVEKIQLEGDT